MAKDLCMIGSIVAAHGIRGAVKVQSFSDVPGRFGRLDDVLLGTTPERVRPARVVTASDEGPRVILRFEGSEDRDSAEALVGLNVYIDVADMAAPPEGRHFIHDLIGCTVRTTSGTYRGTVRDVMLLPANDVYVVDYHGFEVLIPAVPAFVTEVDTARKAVTIETVPGLFDEYDELLGTGGSTPADGASQADAPAPRDGAGASDED
jgi:16S rRNA processing protein RimM